jgi:hypothetical protein
MTHPHADLIARIKHNRRNPEYSGSYTVLPIDDVDKIIAALSAPVAVAQAMQCPEVMALVDGMQWLRRIVEEIDGALVHGTWRDEHGRRFKDTSAWVAAYVALAAIERDVVAQHERDDANAD